MWFKVIFFVAFIFCASLALKPRVKEGFLPLKKFTPGFRLPKNVELYQQDVILEPNIPNFSFNGSTSIVGSIIQETDKIILHSKDLSISNFKIFLDDVDVTSQISISFDLEKEFLIVNLYQIWNTVIFKLSFQFSGILNNDKKGLYRASYLDENGNVKWFATTQGEPTYARMIFPCFDEPSFKVMFNVSIIRSQDLVAIANGNKIQSIECPDSKVIDKFSLTPRMSSYLIAAVVSDFTNVSSGIHGVYAKPQAISDMRGLYALDMSGKVLGALEAYTGVSYKMSKIDQVAVPDDYFTFGAMENWGLVIYRERLLLYKENISTTEEKQAITTIIAHEYAHQWFGNLVSPIWWSYIWLNEGFATYFEFYIADVLEPTWRIMDQFGIKNVHIAMVSDSLETTRPMTFDAGTPEEIDALFDNIAYEKSGSVIRMLEHVLTTPIFRHGLQLYLRKMAYSSAAEDDLYNSFQEAVDIANITLPFKVSNIMMTWSLQSGYPVVTVHRNTDGSILLTQERFLLFNSTHTSNQIWYIPINFATTQNSNFSDTKATNWLTSSNQVIQTNLEVDSWIILNKQQTGFYRVNYDLMNWQNIISNLLIKKDDIHVLNRAQLLDDSFNLARSGRLPYAVAFDLLSYIKNETDYVPLYTFFQHLEFLDVVLSEDRNYNLLKTFIANLLLNSYIILGTDLVENEDHLERLNRINVLNWMCKYNYGDCAQKMHEKLISTSYVEPDLQDAVYCGAMRFENGNDLDYLLNLYDDPKTEPYQRRRIGRGLGCTSNLEVLQRLLDRSEIELFNSVYIGTKEGLNLAFNYFIDNFEMFVLKYSREQIASILYGLSRKLSTQTHLDLFIAFINNLDSENLQIFYYNLMQSKLTIERNVNWVLTYSEEISIWLEDKLNNNV